MAFAASQERAGVVKMYVEGRPELLPAIPAEMKETPSVRAKKIADLFIAALVKETSLQVVSPQEFLTQEEHRALTILCTSEIISVLEKGEKGTTEFRVLGRGKHNIVWVHPQHPRVVFKIMTKIKAKKQEEISRQAYAVTQQIERCWVKIPRAATIDLDEISVYVEERLPLELDMDQHAELWARVLDHYKSEQVTKIFKTNLKILINQIQILIERVGFWDVGDHNLPEVSSDGSGVCGTDFENVETDLSNKHEGLERLAQMVPYPSLGKEVLAALEREFPKAAEQRRKQHQALYGQFLEFAPPEPTEEGLRFDFYCSYNQAGDKLEAYTEALKEYERMGYVTGDEPIRATDLNEMTQEEKTLAEEMIAQIKKRQDAMKGIPCTLCRKRTINFQPGAGSPPFSTKACQAVYTHERFTIVLSMLQRQGIVLGWSSDYVRKKSINNLACASYQITF